MMTAQDGVEALAQTDLFKPDVVILDLMLPDMDGMHLAERLLSQPNLGIIMLTGRDGVADRVVGLRLGADDYIVKPFDFDELVARIRADIL